MKRCVAVFDWRRKSCAKLCVLERAGNADEAPRFASSSWACISLIVRCCLRNSLLICSSVIGALIAPATTAAIAATATPNRRKRGGNGEILHIRPPRPSPVPHAPPPRWRGKRAPGRQRHTPPRRSGGSRRRPSTGAMLEGACWGSVAAPRVCVRHARALRGGPAAYYL